MEKAAETGYPCRCGHGGNTLCAIAIGGALAGLLAIEPASAAGTLEHAPYSKTQGGQAVDIYTMSNDHGMRVRFLSYGGVITEIDVPDRAGRVDNVVLGQRGLLEYETLLGHFGAITGRYANRIGGAQFTLNGQTYHLILIMAPTRYMAAPTRSITRSGRSPRKRRRTASPPALATSARMATRAFPAR